MAWCHLEWANSNLHAKFYENDVNPYSFGFIETWNKLDYEIMSKFPNKIFVTTSSSLQHGFAWDLLNLENLHVIFSNTMEWNPNDLSY